MHAVDLAPGIQRLHSKSLLLVVERYLNFFWAVRILIE